MGKGGKVSGRRLYQTYTAGSTNMPLHHGTHLKFAILLPSGCVQRCATVVLPAVTRGQDGLLTYSMHASEAHIHGQSHLWTVLSMDIHTNG